MDVFGSRTLLILLFYIPGYVFVCVKDYFLLKRQKGQFEKTIQGLVASIFLFLIYMLLVNLASIPFAYFLKKARPKIVEEVLKTLKIFLIYNKNDAEKFVAFITLQKVILYVAFVFFCFFSGCLWAGIWRSNFVINNIKKLTSRDYFEKVELGFYEQFLDKEVCVSLKNGEGNFYGYLAAAPDNENDVKLVLANPCRVDIDLPARVDGDRILININEVNYIVGVNK